MFLDGVAKGTPVTVMSGRIIVCTVNSALGYLRLSNVKTNAVGFKKFLLILLFIRKKTPNEGGYHRA